MGVSIDIDHVTPSTNAAIELRCGLCRKLASLDCVVTEECSHLFCKSCAESFLSGQQQGKDDRNNNNKKSVSCPTCNTSIPSTSIATSKHALKGANGQFFNIFPLKIQQPLAYRILTRIQVCCPIQKQKTTCTWVGEYRQLSKHNKTAHHKSRKTAVAGTSTSRLEDSFSHLVDATSKHTTRSAPAPSSSSNKKSTSHGNGKHRSRRDLHRHQSERAHRTEPKPARSLSPTTVHNMLRENSSNDQDEQRQQIRRSNSDSSLQVDSKQKGGHKTPANDGSKRRRGNNHDNDRLQTLRDMATKAFKSGNYEESRDRYTDAIAVCRQRLQGTMSSPSHPTEMLLGTLYANRAAASFKLKDREGCIEDTDEAIKLHPRYPKAYLRRAWALAELGEFEEACTTLHTGEKKCMNGGASTKELSAELKRVKKSRDLMLKSEKLLSQQKYAQAEEHIVALNHRSNSSRVVLALARADLGLGNTSKVIGGTNTVLQSNSRHVQALQLRGEAHFFNGNFKEAVNDLTSACIIDPDSSAVTATLKRYRDMQRYIFDAKGASQSRNYKKALEDCTAAMLIQQRTPLPATTTLFRVLYTERGEAYLGLGKHDEALEDANIVLDQSKDDYFSAWSLRIRCLKGQGKHQQICDDLEPIIKGWGSTNDFFKRALEEAKWASGQKEVSGGGVRNDGSVDFYKLLGIPRDATVGEIRKKYKHKAKSLHPDRFSGPQYTEQDRKRAEEDFKVLGEALEILCDSYCRTLYDAGHDLSTIRKEADAAARRRAQEAAQAAARSF